MAVSINFVDFFEIDVELVLRGRTDGTFGRQNSGCSAVVNDQLRLKSHCWLIVLLAAVGLGRATDAMRLMHEIHSR